MTGNAASPIPCVPRIGASPRFPHELELSCWEHGEIGTFGYSARASDICAAVTRHHATVTSENPPSQVSS